MSATFVLLRSTDQQFYFQLEAFGGEPLLISERYTAKHNAQNGIESVRANAPLDERYERRTSSAEQPYFVLKAANHEIIGTSRMYDSAADRERAIELVKADAPDAPVDDKARSNFST